MCGVFLLALVIGAPAWLARNWGTPQLVAFVLLSVAFWGVVLGIGYREIKKDIREGR